MAMYSYHDSAGVERCDECDEPIEYCTCTCDECGDQIHECACGEG